MKPLMSSGNPTSASPRPRSTPAMDPDRSDGPDPPDPGSEPEAAEEAEAVESNELQEELARLASLSLAVHKAKERKDALTRRIESILKAREESLRRRYALESMRQKLNLKKTALEDLRMRKEKTSKDVEGKRKQLCLEIRTLLVAAKNLSAAQQQMQEANKLLAGEMGRGKLKNVEKKIRMQQQDLVALVATIYPVEAINEQPPAEKPDLHFGGDWIVFPRCACTSGFAIFDNLGIAANHVSQDEYFQ